MFAKDYAEGNELLHLSRNKLQNIVSTLEFSLELSIGKLMEF